MVKNILFDTKAAKVTASAETPPICPVSGLPMERVICGSYNKKKFYAWFSRASKLIVPIFKSPEA